MLTEQEKEMYANKTIEEKIMFAKGEIIKTDLTQEQIRRLNVLFTFIDEIKLAKNNYQNASFYACDKLQDITGERSESILDNLIRIANSEGNV